MSSDQHPDIVAQLARLAELASLDYQSFQLAAQRADIEGHALAAGVLRSISEGHAGKVHGLLTMAEQIDSTQEGRDTTEAFLQSAIYRASEMEDMSSTLSAKARATLDRRQSEDLDAVLNLTATSRQRLERLLAGLASR